MPLQQTSGNVTADAYGGGAAVKANYIEDVFSTYLYTGNGSTQTINNGIDLAGKGGLVWIKDRIYNSNHFLFDTVQGATKYLSSNATNASTTDATSLTAFNANGFAIGSNADINFNASKLASWTFREQPKFFDVVTYTGTGSPQTIAHNLGSVPGCIITKCTSTTGTWITYHRSLGSTDYVNLNTTAATTADSGAWNNTNPTSTNFTVGSGNTNNSGATYVAYIFAHNAGGFGPTGTDNVISCGSYTGTGTTGLDVAIGYEPQWLLIKRATTAAANWYLLDNMRGLSMTTDAYLFPNSSAAEASADFVNPTATGFQIVTTSSAFNASGDTYIYIAIRRGPMKVPTDATKVFKPIAVTQATGTDVVTGFPIDMHMYRYLSGTDFTSVLDRLRGFDTTGASSIVVQKTVYTNATLAEEGPNAGDYGYNSTGYKVGSNVGGAYGGSWSFRRAPGFFDEVCYTGDGASTKSVSHNLTVTPELIIAKKRSAISDWGVYSAGQADGGLLNTTDGFTISNRFTSVGATSFSVKLGGTPSLNDSGATYVTYLFASCPGVSKVGSYTGNGTTQTINCGFTGGARFVLIKRTDSTGDWYVYDTARGMTTLTDPYLLLNSTAAESATLGSVTTVTTGFAVNASVLAAINTNAASYIYLAIA